MSMYVSVKVGLSKVIDPNGVIIGYTIGYTWRTLFVNVVSTSWTGGLDRWVNVEKVIQPFLHLIFSFLKADASLSQIELSVYNLDVRLFALIVLYFG